ncbi:hypothetical protein PV367_12710 [Streptomyces europaeiscabiei]|uniref:Uncharacterized protein n=1 Tax=Streptomyces europaeiscabiei TaxID=146819 RepID=A0AAJ2UL74_9ACTN|nr:hypothetical protein [Streptomyces europaeiscabiei]MDX3130635.1 hypothetical protein [Streptomyces europaeiscabiei]
MIRDLASGNQGVTEGNDLKIREWATPGAGVRVGDGSAVVTGAAWGQGSYTQYNVGDSLVPIAPTGSSARSDLVCLRVEDPEYEGNRNPASDDIGYFHVVSGVSASAKTVPSGMTAIPLARLDLPANTATITSAMITDLRRIANPRRDRKLYTAYPSALSELKYQDNKWHSWPPAANWSVPIPAWADSAKVVVTIAGLRMARADVFASMQTKFGSDLGQNTIIDDNQGAVIRRQTVVVADNITISAAQRGTTQKLALQTYMSKAETGDLSVDGSTSIIADVEFSEGVL